MPVSLSVLESAKERLLRGDFSLATSYYIRALKEDIPVCVVDLRYLTKNYLVYPIEYTGSCIYFEHLKVLKNLAEKNQEYLEEYKTAVASLINFKTLFLRAVSLFYFSDIEITPRDSAVIMQISELLSYLKQNADLIAVNDIYEIQKYFPRTNMEALYRDLNVVEAYCLNMLLSYTAVQDRAYIGKEYNAFTIDYGSFATTDIYSRDRYAKWAVLKPRLFLIGKEAYYDDYLREYKEKVKKLGGFHCPKMLQKELTVLVQHTYRKKGDNKEFHQYAKVFAREDASRVSLFKTLNNFANVINPLKRLDFISNGISKDRVCSFELDTYFRRKMIWGVCDMLSCGQGWNISTVRAIMCMTAACAGMGIIAYVVLAIAMRLGFYLGVEIEKH